MSHAYPNPLIPGFHPDPSVVRVGDECFLATSTFEYLPGIPIHRSRDFENWEHIGHVATRVGQFGIDEGARRRAAPGRRRSGTATACSTS